MVGELIRDIVNLRPGDEAVRLDFPGSHGPNSSTLKVRMTGEDSYSIEFISGETRKEGIVNLAAAIQIFAIAWAV